MVKSINIRIADELLPMTEKIVYLFKILLKPYQDVGLALVPVVNDTAVSIGTSLGNTIRVNGKFVEGTLSKELLNENCLFVTETGEPDYFSTAFFMITGMQEVHDRDPDALGRFKYANSYQYKFGNSKTNIVQVCFEHLRAQLKLKAIDAPTTFFLSHDIDTVYGAILEDGFNVLKKGRIDIFFRLLVHVAMARPDWLNIDKIMKLESAYDCTSTFFWIVNKGVINKREKNADYDFKSPFIQKYFKAVEAAGFENGIHKSISPESFETELKKFGATPLSNRYHYLKFRLPEGFEAVENSGLQLDASLGFAEEPGFRSSYGLPYNPYDFKNQRPFRFVEVPLHIMDRTYFQYKKFAVDEAERDILEFFEKNKRNAVISILWHNNFFSNYKFKGYLDLYKVILAYLYENKFRTIRQEEIIRTYSIV